MKRWVVPCLLAVCLSGCASLTTLIIKTDQTLASLVFAADDAEWQACHVATPPTFPSTTCAVLDADVLKALNDVRAVTTAIQTAPTQAPTSLPVLIADLENLSTTLTALQPLSGALLTPVSNATTSALQLLTKFTGVQ